MRNPFQDNVLHRPDQYRPEWDIPSLNAEITQQLAAAIRPLKSATATHPGQRIEALLGTPGYGKTHLFGRILHQLRDEAILAFVPQIDDPEHPLDHIRWHTVESLFRPAHPQGYTCLQMLLAKHCQDSFIAYYDWLDSTETAAHHQLSERLRANPLACLEIVAAVPKMRPFQLLAQSLERQFPQFRGEVMRMLALGWSPQSEKARRWLRGESLSEESLRELGLPHQEIPPSSADVLRGISALCVGQTPLVICCDQLETVLEHPVARNRLANELMNLLHHLPNVLLVISCHYDRWHLLCEEQSFAARCRTHRLSSPGEAQLVDLVRLRLRNWDQSRESPDELWPFHPDSLRQLLQKTSLGPRGLLKICQEELDKWLDAEQPDQLISLGGEVRKPPEVAFQEEWDRQLARLRQDESRSLQNTSEAQFHRTLGELLELVRSTGDGELNGVRLVNIQEEPFPKSQSQKRYGRLLTITRNGQPERVILAFTKIESAKSMTPYLNACQQAVTTHKADKLILVHHQEELSLGKAGQQALDKLEEDGKLVCFPLISQIKDFEWLECYRELKDQFAAGTLLAEYKLQWEDIQDLVVKHLQLLEHVKLLEQIFGSGQEPPVPVNMSEPVASVATPPDEIPFALPLPTGETIASQVARAQQVAAKPVAGTAKPVVTTAKPAVAQAGGTAEEWAAQVLRDIVRELKHFNYDLEPVGVRVGARFARLIARPLKKTTINHVKRKAEDLKARLEEITSTPVVDSQSNGLSIDVQLPERFRRVVSLSDLLKYAPARQSAPVFPIGQDVAGQGYWADLSDANQPHYLVAGTTGSGKSEFLKALIAGLALRLSPDQLQLILIDPKRVTFNFPPGALSPYFPVAPMYTTEEALPKLKWCFEETERRYEELSRLGFKDLEQWAARTPNAPPRVVVVCDEYPQLVADDELRKELETPLKRVGMLSRAAGIHLVLAAQRPDAQTVTPQLRQSLQGRVCLRVAGANDSNLILDDKAGADLLGKGDLLWKAGLGLQRLQGALVSEDEFQQALRIQ